MARAALCSPVVHIATCPARSSPWPGLHFALLWYTLLHVQQDLAHGQGCTLLNADHSASGTGSPAAIQVNQSLNSTMLLLVMLHGRETFSSCLRT